MTIYYLTPISAIFQYFNDVGVILSGGKINTYLAGSSTPQATYTDITGGTPNGNPVPIASNGRLNNVQIWQPSGVKLKIVISDSNNNIIGPTFDQIPGINDPTSILASLNNPAFGSGADLVANAMRSYDLITNLRGAIPPSLSAGQTLVISVEGSVIITDNLGGFFYWNASSTATDDGVNVVKPSSLSVGTPGRYLRLVLTPSGIFLATLTGVSGTVTANLTYKIFPGFMASISLDIQGISNSNSMSITGVPLLLQPSVSVVAPCQLVDNNISKGGWALINAAGGGGAGTINFGIGFDNNVTGFTNSLTTKGTGGASGNFSIIYPL